MADLFQPAGPTPVDPNDALADLEADFQAVTDPPQIIVVEQPPPPIGRSWAFDFPRERFVTGGGHGALTTNGAVTLIYWMEKCLRTARGAHPIHPPGYGLVKPTELIGGLVSGAPIAELEARVRDALTFHPRIVDIEDFGAADIDPADEYLAISFTVVLDDDTRLPVNTSLSLTTTVEF